MRHASAPALLSRQPPVLAWSASVGLHLALVSAVLWSLQSGPMPASWGRRVGALMVRLVTLPAHPQPAPAPQTRVAPPSPHPHTPSIHAPTVKPASVEPHKPSVPTQTPMPTPAPAPTPAASQGATFANLFAPIISRPMGRGHWGAMPHQPVAPMPDQMQQQQMAMAKRGQLVQQIQALQQSLWQEPLAGRCDIRLALLPSQGLVNCAEPEDTQRVAGMLGGFLTQGAALLTAQADACFHAELNRVISTGCSAEAPKENGPEGPPAH